MVEIDSELVFRARFADCELPNGESGGGGRSTKGLSPAKTSSRSIVNGVVGSPRRPPRSST